MKEGGKSAASLQWESTGIMGNDVVILRKTRTKNTAAVTRIVQ